MLILNAGGLCGAGRWLLGCFLYGSVLCYHRRVHQASHLVLAPLLCHFSFFFGCSSHDQMRGRTDISQEPKVHNSLKLQQFGRHRHRYVKFWGSHPLCQPLHKCRQNQCEFDSDVPLVKFVVSS